MALELGRTVIPVYFDDARQLEAAELPAGIRELALRHSCRIRWEAADADLDRLHDVVLAAASARR